MTEYIKCLLLSFSGSRAQSQCLLLLAKLFSVFQLKEEHTGAVSVLL